METRRWTNPSQPQTLYLASVLLYIRAVLLVLFGAFVNPLGLLLVLGSVAGGLGIANEKKWGYIVGVIVATLGLLPFILAIAADGVSAVFSIRLLINAIFPVALFALLVHPMSREYQRIWFR
jgi:hypothetical protein